jgi:hypothetical protein
LLPIMRWLIWVSLHWSVECASIQVCRRKYWIARHEYIQGACFSLVACILLLVCKNKFQFIEGIYVHCLFGSCSQANYWNDINFSHSVC